MRGRSLLAVAVVLVAFAAAGGVARATELHSFFDAECRRVTGVLVHVTAEQIMVVGLDGNYYVRPRAEVAGIAVHKTLENPLAQIVINEGLKGHLRDVWVGDDVEPTFTGWTTAFFDELFLYFDLEGQTHVLDPEEIQRIRPSRYSGIHKPRVHAPVTLAFPAEVIPCGSKQAPPPDSVLPSRVIADRIKVGDYLGKLEERYLAQAGFEERTYVYAEPFIFQVRARLGLLYDKDWRIPFPIYVRWSNGRPYRFQSLTVLGNASHEWLPQVAPSLSARSDIKSHFFNGSFIGHILSLPAGTDAFLLSEPPELPAGSAPRVDHGYNYVLLMGADFWRLSASAGISYLASRISAAQVDPRTVLATGISPTARLRFQGRKLALRALYFRTRASGPLSDVLPDEADSGMDERFRWRLDTLRLGATWTPFETVEVSADQIVSLGKYQDAYSMGPVEVSLLELTSNAEVAISFGRYVTVRGTARLYLKRYDQSQPSPVEDTVNERRFGGALEFVF